MNFIFYFIIALFCCSEISFGQTEKKSNFEKEQDSLRTILIHRKENKDILNSVFQELYIRDNLEIKGEIIIFNIYLDLHFWDCGAPDIFTHHLNFNINKKQINNLPKRLLITETKIEKEKKDLNKKIEFELLCSKNDYFIYHSEKFRKTLIVFKSDKKSGTSLYYFQKLNRKKILNTSIDKIVEDGYNDVDAPWHSRQLQLDYDNFL